jgi:hypothetical protein
LGVFYRWWPRDMRKLCQKQNAGYPPNIHLSVLERIAHGTDGYAPGTLAPEVKVVFTPSGVPEQDQALAVCAKAVNEAVTIALASRAKLEEVGGTIAVGQAAYYIYVVSCLAVIVFAAILKNPGAKLNPWTVAKNAGTLVYDAATGQWGPLWESAKLLVRNSDLLLILLVGFAVAAILAYYVDHVRSRAFSLFWHTSRHQLREALKDARNSMLGKQGADAG